MASMRVPLASNPNAINSPLRPSVTGKRPRAVGLESRGQELEQAPPKKKQAVEGPHHDFRRTQAFTLNERDGKVFEAKQHIAPQTEFQRKLTATNPGRARESQRPSAENEDKIKLTDKEQVKTWRRHYQKVFPNFVFYLESVPHDASTTASRAIAHLGAREEKFFSKNVTHIVTTRPIPASSSEPDSSRSSSSKTGIQQSQNCQTRTINPSLLEKNGDLQWKTSMPKNRLTADILSQRRPLGPIVENESRRHQSSSADILTKAKEMGIKVWPLEKFERMLNTLLDLGLENDQEPVVLKKAAATLGHAHATKQHATEQDLSQLLRKEKSMPNDRPPWSDVVPFRAFYVYVHDAEETHRPVMVREFAKPGDKEEGDWPQLHSVQAPRCPFLADPTSKRSDIEKDATAAKIPRTRAAEAAIETTKARIAETRARASARPRVEAEQSRSQTRAGQTAPPQFKVFEPPQLKQSTTSISDSLPAHLNNRFHFQGIPRPNAGREPLASGLQQSKPTSAIHSHMISSTAANPAARLGKSKEMHELQRRAVEQRRSGLSANSVNSEYANDMRAAINQNSVPSQTHRTLRKASEPMAKIYEDETQSDEDEEEEESRDRDSRTRSSKAVKKRKAPKREPKPGYCENCRDKYDDFSEHILSKKHRKFATAGENFKELDLLLKKLARQ